MQLTFRILDELFKVTNLFLHFPLPEKSEQHKEKASEAEHETYCIFCPDKTLHCQKWSPSIVRPAHLSSCPQIRAACCLGACTFAGSFWLCFSIISAFTFILCSLSHYLSIQAQIANPLECDWKCGFCKWNYWLCGSWLVEISTRIQNKYW